MSNLRSVLNNTYTLLRNDEDLLRLLHYPPQRVTTEPDPLDREELLNILEKPTEKYWEIVDNHILLTSKSDDLVKQRICRIYVYTGKIRPSLRNRLTTKQEIVVDIFVHHEYESDQRLQWITDQLNEVMFKSRIEGGLGTVDYRNGYDFNAPKGYQAYRHIYEVGGSK